MKMKTLFLAAFLLATPVLSAAIPLLNFGVGMFDISRAHPHMQYQVEYRFGYRWYGVGMPFAGLMMTARGSGYLYGGLAADLVKCGKLSFMPSFAIGLYNKGGGKNLYYPVQFRSAVECAYIFKNQMRLGLQFSHISNANLGHHNPGEESLVISLSLPLSKACYLK